MQEIQIRLNKLEFSGETNVTTIASQIEDIYTIPASAKANMKTMMIHNTTSDAVYFGSNNSVTVASGIPIQGAETREIPLMNLENSPFFIAAADTDIRLEIWS